MVGPCLDPTEIELVGQVNDLDMGELVEAHKSIRGESVSIKADRGGDAVPVAVPWLCARGADPAEGFDDSEPRVYRPVPAASSRPECGDGAMVAPTQAAAAVSRGRVQHDGLRYLKHTKAWHREGADGTRRQHGGPDEDRGDKPTDEELGRTVAAVRAEDGRQDRDSQDTADLPDRVHGA